MKFPFLKKIEENKLHNPSVIQLLLEYLKEYKNLEEEDKKIIRNILKIYLINEK